jgi:hypothetical protein
MAASKQSFASSRGTVPAHSLSTGCASEIAADARWGQLRTQQ